MPQPKGAGDIARGAEAVGERAVREALPSLLLRIGGRQQVRHLRIDTPRCHRRRALGRNGGGGGHARVRTRRVQPGEHREARRTAERRRHRPREAGAAEVFAESIDAKGEAEAIPPPPVPSAGIIEGQVEKMPPPIPSGFGSETEYSS